MSSSDTSPAEPMIAPFQVFKLQYDAVSQLTINNNVIPSIIARFVDSGLTSQGTNYLNIIATQWGKLQYHFNMYEEFTILEDKVDYEPLFNHSDTTAYQSADSAEPKTSKSAQWVIANALMSNTTKITLLADKNDHEITNTVDSYYQARSRSEARTFRLNQPWTFAVRPSVNDLRIISNPNPSIVTTSNQPFIPNVMSGVSNTSPWLEWGPPEKLGWLPTKVMNPSNQWVINYTPNYYGHKEWIYIPLAPLVGVVPTTVEYGIKTRTFTFAFRKFDYRPIYGMVGAEALLATEVQLETVLNDVTKRGLIHDGADEPSFKKVKTDEDDQRDAIRSRVIVPESL